MVKPNHVAEVLYSSVRNRGRQGQVRSFVSRCSCFLRRLAEVEATCRINDRYEIGVRTVKISQIQGSRGRSQDFDRDFNLLGSHNKDRWLHVAEAKQRGVPLPLIKLIQVGDLYFVSDGHHRISVARAFGQREMEARVTVWQVDGPLPWEKSATPNLRKLNPNISRLARRVWAEGRQLQTRLVLNLSDLLIAVELKLKVRQRLQTVFSTSNA